VLTSRMSRDPG